MNGEGRQTGSYGDELTNAAMIGLVALFGVALVLRGAGSVAAWITGTNQPLVAPPPASVCCSIPVIPSPVAYWIVAGLLLTGLVVGGVWAWSWLRLHNHRVEQDPRRMAGVATRSEVTVAASEKALLRRAANLRPDLSLDPWMGRAVSAGRGC